jgi:hypothetical protein
VIQKAARTPNSPLLPEEEEHVIAWIGEHQRKGDCPSRREVRDFAGDLFERRTHHEWMFTREWWRGFRKRQGEELLGSVGAAKEAQRTEVTRGSGLACFAELGNVLLACVTPNQIMNMDETGFSVRPMKGKTRKPVSLKSCSVRPTLHEEKDVSHVSLVATVTIGGQTLTPLMLTTTDLPFTSEELVILRRTFAAYRTARDYMTAASMMFYLNHIVAPYVMFLRVTRQDPALMVDLVMDNDGEEKEQRKIAPPPCFHQAHSAKTGRFSICINSQFTIVTERASLGNARPLVARNICSTESPADRFKSHAWCRTF